MFLLFLIPSTISLPLGSQGDDSSASSPYQTSCIFSDIDEDAQEVPELSLEQVPFHFLFPPLRNEYEDPEGWNSDPSPDSPFPPKAGSVRHPWLAPPNGNYISTPHLINPTVNSVWRLG